MRLPNLFLGLFLCFTVTNAGLVDDIIDAIKNAATCAACHTLLTALKPLALIGDGAFTSTFTAVCKGVTALDDDVCEGAVGTQAPILAHALREINPLGHTARKLCDALLGLCQPPKVNAYQVPFPKPAPTNPKKFVSTGKPTFKVVHFSDIHIDRNYTPGADAVCTKPICCRNWADDNSAIESPAGPMGSRNCDTPTALAQHFLRTISSENKFSIFTGDVIEATVWLADRDVINHDVERFTGEIATLPSVPVYAAVGNHESSPTNAFPRNTSIENNQWLFDTLSKGWAPVIGAAAAQQVAHLSGSYSVVVPGTNLRLISVNTVYWYKTNFWLYDSNTRQPDPNGVLAFVVSQLQLAEDAGQRAWIVGHIPPGGRKDVLHDQSNYFNQIIQRYKHVIAGQFYGHSHQDEFMVGYSDYAQRTAANAVTFGMVAPAFTPRSSNPGFKVYDIDPDTYEIMDVKVYRTDTTTPDFQVSPKWKMTYSARQTYGPYVPSLQAQDALSPAFWHQLTEAFEKNDAAFTLYRSLKRGLGAPEACDAECKAETICDMRAMRAENLCSKSSPGLNLRRDLEGHDHEHDDSCEGQGMGHIFASASHKKDVDWNALKAQLEAILGTD